MPSGYAEPSDLIRTFGVATPPGLILFLQVFILSFLTVNLAIGSSRFSGTNKCGLRDPRVQVTLLTVGQINLAKRQDLAVGKGDVTNAFPKLGKPSTS